MNNRLKSLSGRRQVKRPEWIISVIENAKLDISAENIAKNIYNVIGKAEADVHGASFATIHFHEVGRDDAVKMIVGISVAIASLDIDEIYCSHIHDGHGSVKCSYGVLPVARTGGGSNEKAV